MIAVDYPNIARQRNIMAKIIDARSKIIDLRLDLDDALAELVNVTAWADEDTLAEQKAALDSVTACRKRLADAEAKIDRLHRTLENARRP